MVESVITGQYAYVVPLASGVATTLIGILVWWNGRHDLQSKILAIFVAVLSFWLLGSSVMFRYCAEAETALLMDRIIYIFVAAMPAVAFHLATIFTRSRERVLPVVGGYTIMLLFWVLLWSPAFIDGMNHYINGCHSQAQVMHHFFLVYFVGYSMLTLHHIFGTYKREPHGERKIQLQFLMFALAAQAIVGTSAFLPAYGINSITFGYFSGIFTTFILVYAMFRHNLLELRAIAMKIFVSLVVVASGLQVFIVDDTTLKIVNGVVFVLICILGFLVAKNVQEEIENREKGERLARYLANANARLRELDKQKTEFVSIASHQLRGPIAAITGYTSLINEGSYGKVPGYLAEPLSRIHESGKRISIMVDDFLNVTRIEQGRMSFSMRASDVRAMLKKEVEEMSVIATKKGIDLVCVCDHDEEPVMISADESKLQQVFQNLIDNALKYTPEGSITISLRLTENKQRVLISFTDTGIGIAAEDVPKLFQKFNRASNANTVSVYGAGLGLYIAREIIKAHEGWVHIASPGIGQGSTFTVELPLLGTTGAPPIDSKTRTEPPAPKRH